MPKKYHKNILEGAAIEMKKCVPNDKSRKKTKENT